MTEILSIVVLTLGAGICVPVGGVLASVEHISPRWLEREFRHFMIALGGGLLLGAVVEVLLPEGTSQLGHPIGGISLFIAGGVVFFIVERLLGLRRRETPQLLGMLLDFIPEAIALGGLVASGSSAAPLLALLIGLQNIPEGFNAYRELVTRDDVSSASALRFMTYLTLIGPAVGVLGYLLLGNLPRVLGAIMLMASGGILYLIFQDIAPQSRLNRHWAPPLGAVVGFGATLIAQIFLGHA